jgi:hypothetical protein
MTNEYWDTDWDANIVALQQEMNIAELIKEYARLEAYLDTHDEDDHAVDHLDDVRDAINKTIYEDNQVLAITKWGQPVFNRGILEHLVDELSDEDKNSVLKFVEERCDDLCKWYETLLSYTFAPRGSLKCANVVKKLRQAGVEAVWEKEDGADAGRWVIANPTYTQTMGIESDNGRRNGGVDSMMIIANHDDDSFEDEYSSIRKDIDRRLLEFTFSKPAATSPHIDVIPMLHEIFGDKLATGAEALPLMSPEGFDAWKLYYLGIGVYEPQVIESKEAEMAV